MNENTLQSHTDSEPHFQATERPYYYIVQRLLPGTQSEPVADLTECDRQISPYLTDAVTLCNLI